MKIKKEKKKVIIMIFLIFIFSFLMIKIVNAQNKYLTISLKIEGTNPKEIAYYNKKYNFHYYITEFLDYNISLLYLEVNTYNREIFPKKYNGNSKFFTKLYYSNLSIIKKNFSPSFLLLSDPPQKLNSTIVDICFPFSRNITKLEIYYNNELKLVINLSLCNYDNICNGYENIYSCPDCKIGDKDNICPTELMNKSVCDPDCIFSNCYKEEKCGDNVCNFGENYQNCPKDCPLVVINKSLYPKQKDYGDLDINKISNKEEFLKLIRMWIFNKIKIDILFKKINFSNLK